MRIALAVVAVFLASALLVAKDDTALKKLLDDGAVSDGWIYEDIDAAYGAATRSGKPLLVSFSCVP